MALIIGRREVNSLFQFPEMNEKATERDLLGIPVVRYLGESNSRGSARARKNKTIYLSSNLIITLSQMLSPKREINI